MAKLKRNTPAKSRRSQAALEYLTTYAWAILLITIVAVLSYIYMKVPSTLPSSCTFINGFYCKDIVLQSNTVTHNTLLTVALTNAQAYAIGNPKLFVSINTTNTTSFACAPNFVLPGGSILCTASIPISTNLGVLLAGDLYLNATYCGLLGNYIYTGNCIGAPRETYHGTFSGHTETQISTTSTITLNAINSTQYANNAKDPLMATVKLNGYPIGGATVNFTLNNMAYTISPALTDTNSSGVALSYVWGTTINSVVVTATYAGLSNSVTIQFIAVPTTTAITTSIPTVPTSISSTTTTIAQYIYCVGTGATSPYTQVYYAPVSSTGVGAWTSTASYPVAMYEAGCSIYNGYIYCVGTGAISPYTQVYYAPVSSTGIGTWTSTKSYPVAIYGAGCSVSGGYIYCVGSDAPSMTQMVYYAPVSSTGIGTWSSTRNYPIYETDSGCSVSGGYIYCVGTSFSSPFTQVYYTQVSSTGAGIQWSSTTFYPVTMPTGCSISGGYIYCVGVQAGSPYTQVYYAPVSSTGIGTWTSTTSYPVAMYGAGCTINGGYIYCVGTQSGSVHTEVYYAPVSSTGVGTWTSTTSYPIAMKWAYCEIPGSGGGYLGGGG